MNKKIDIRGNYKRRVLNFNSNILYQNLPYVDVVLKNIETSNTTDTTQEFLFDTGASISILNIKYEEFLKDIPIIDYLNIQYGGGRQKKLPVYRIGIIIKGIAFEINAAYDGTIPFNLLGHFSFFDNLSYLLFDSAANQLRMIKT